MISGLILAAGRSSRMGKSKALLSIAPRGASFVRQIATVLLAGGVADVLVVGRPDDSALREEVDQIGVGVRYVVNEDSERGQLSSLLVGLNVADRPGIDALLVTPVDAPLIQASTVATLIGALHSSNAAIVRAAYHGRHGHPVIFGRAVFNDLRHADPSVGAKAVLRTRQADVLDVEVDDPAVLHDIDRAEDYQRLIVDR